MKALLLNGQLINDIAHAVSAEDRGFQYGDGIFETMLLKEGRVRLLTAHLTRMQLSCERLGISAPADVDVRADIAAITTKEHDGVLKLVVTRGVGGRGYRAATAMQATRLLSLYSAPLLTDAGITLRWCATRLARNAQLAGMKHLNRLEQVLAQNEWHDPAIDDALMLDTEGELIAATAANVFMVIGGKLVTPDLRFCGVRGVMREWVLAAAAELGISVEVRAVLPQELSGANEVFITNAIKGLRAVVQLEQHRWAIGPVTQRLAALLKTS